MYGCTETSGQVFRKIFCWGLLDGVTLKGGRIPVHVFNYLNKPLKIYRCSIGDRYSLAGKEESQKETNVGVGYKVVPSAASKEEVEFRLEAKQCSVVFVRDADLHG